MLRLILVSLLVAVAVGQNFETRIVGGNNANEGQFPYQVSIRSAANAHICGGSIINDRWILSAAHCTFGRTTANTIVVVGSVLLNSGGVVHLTNVIINHQFYISTTYENDISVVQTVTTIGFNAQVSAIALGATTIPSGVSAIASGWGLTNNGTVPDNLQFVQVTTLSNIQCKSRHTVAISALIFYSTLCSYAPAGKGICQGDSGGPLVANGAVIGVASWVVLPCGSGRPDAWARVSAFRYWILNSIN